MRITHADWNTRLWTFHEEILAQTCYFQFADRAVSIDEFKDAPKITENLQEVSHILSTIDKDEILREQSILNLLRALTSIDPRGVEILEEYGSLPPQTDPEREVLRKQTIEHRANLRR